MSKAACDALATRATAGVLHSVAAFVFSNFCNLFFKVMANFWQNFGKFLANFERSVLGCLDAKFCE